MSPHPRIRKAIKWTGAAATVLLVVVWIGSAWFVVGWAHWNQIAAGLSCGSATVVVCDHPITADEAEWTFERLPVREFAWWFVRQDRPGAGLYKVWIPLWMPIVVLAAATATTWHLDTLARRRERLNLCPKCHYDRAGIGKDAVCPECGSLPA